MVNAELGTTWREKNPDNFLDIKGEEDPSF